MQEGAKNSIELKAIGAGDGDDDACDDPEAVKLMVHFFYHMDYRADVVFVMPATEALSARKTPRIRRLSPGMVSVHGLEAAPSPTSTDGNMVMHAKVFAAAVKYQVLGLRSVASSKFESAVKANWNHGSFAEAAHVVYTTTPEEVRTLRDVVATALTEHADLFDKVEVEAVVRSITGLSYELLKRSREERLKRSREYMY